MDPLAPPTEEPNPVDAAAARIGTALNAAWHLDDLLGVGGMAAVFAATHTTGSRAAVKVLHAELASDADLRDRFLREGKIANRVDHPARVTVLDDDQSDRGEPFLVMELLTGTTLQRLMTSAGGTLPLAQVLPVVDVVLDLLDKCHAVGIIHRDIKPANIFVTSTGDVKVLDFGVARMRGPQHKVTRAGLTFGTPAFMSPEQALGVAGIDGRADVWSVGACIFTLLSGKRLNRGRSEAESYFLAATQAAPSIAGAVPDLPVEIVAFVDKALAFERGNRFQSAAAMRAELRRLLSAHAAGQLTAAHEKKVPRVIVHGNDPIEEDAAPSVAASEQSVLRMVGIWKQLALAFSNIRQYGWNHPQVTKGLQFAYDEVTRALAHSPLGVRWEVAANAFTYNGQVIWQPDRPPFDRIPYQLFADGIRKVQIKPGITEPELRDFVAILLRDRSFGVTEDDDAVTALWDRRFEHIAYLAIDSFAEGDDEQREQFEAECGEIASGARALAQIDSLWDETSLAGRAMQRNLEVALRETGAAASVLAIDPLTRATLAAQIVLPSEQWNERYMDAFVDGYLDAVRQSDIALLTTALTDWTVDQIVLHSYELAFEMQAMLRRAFAVRLDPSGAPRGASGAAAQVEGRGSGGPSGALRPDPQLSRRAIDRTIVNAMFPIEALRAILDDLTTYGPDESQEASAPQRSSVPIDPAILQGLGYALDALDEGTLFGPVCACYGAVQSDRLREVLFGYMRRWAPGREDELAHMLGRAPVSLAAALLQLLVQLRTPEALVALEAGLANPNVEVRISALALLPGAAASEDAEHGVGADRVRDELQKLLDDSAHEVRREALRIIGKLGVVAAGPALVRRIVSPAFHDLPAAERMLWIETVAQLNPGRAEKLAIELLEKRQLIPSEAIEQTREMAAHFLCQARSYEALRAVKEATKPRWWNTPPVRDAAARAAVAIAARLVAPQRTGDRVRTSDGPASASRGMTGSSSSWLGERLSPVPSPAVMGRSSSARPSTPGERLSPSPPRPSSIPVRRSSPGTPSISSAPPSAAPFSRPRPPGPPNAAPLASPVPPPAAPAHPRPVGPFSSAGAAVGARPGGGSREGGAPTHGGSPSPRVPAQPTPPTQPGASSGGAPGAGPANRPGTAPAPRGGRKP